MPQSAAVREDIVHEAMRGNSEAFSVIYDAYKRRIYNLCLRMVRDASEAEDLTQDVFIQLFRRISTFRGESAFSTWLHRLAVNIVLMSIRKKRLLTIPFLETNDDDDTHLVKEYGKQDAVLTFALDRVLLERSVRQLPPGYRIVFLLHDVEGYEHQEIAELLGCSIGNCKSQLHKARAKLRRVIVQSTRQEVKREHIPVFASALRAA